MSKRRRYRASRFTLHASRAKTIAFRVDGGSRIGMGHVARCLVLADGCRRAGMRAVWMTSSRAGLPGDRRIRAFLLPSKPGAAAHARWIAARLPAGSTVVLDGYHLTAGLERSLISRGMKVATLDDNSERRFAAHWILNGNVHARRLRYRKERHSRLAAGSMYYIFSDEVRRARKARREPQQVRRIVVTMGGADPRNQALKVLRGIDLLGRNDLQVTVVVGAACRNLASLRRFARRAAFRCRLVASTDRMGALMAAADLGVSSAGRVATEMAYLGLPGLKIVLAANQSGLVRELHRRGAAVNMGWYRHLTPHRIARALRRLMRDVALRNIMSDKGRQLFDGRGTDRVVKILKDLAGR